MAEFDADMKVGRSRVVYAKDGHSMRASHFDERKSLRQWDYIMADHGGLAAITDRAGRRVRCELVAGIIMTEEY